MTSSPICSQNLFASIPAHSPQPFLDVLAKSEPETNTKLEPALGEQKTNHHYVCDRKDAEALWMDYESDSIFFESFFDTKEFDFFHAGEIVICRTYKHKPTELEPKCTWILKQKPKRKDAALSYVEQTFSSLQELCHNSSVIDLQPKMIRCLRVERFVGGCSQEGCSKEDCSWVDLSVTHEQDLKTPIFAYAVLRCEHKLSHKPAPPKSLVFLQKDLAHLVEPTSEEAKFFSEGAKWWWKVGGRISK